MAEFIRIEGSIKDAILTIIRYVQVTTGVEPTQDEIAEMLKSYFILNEVGNQVKYQLKKKASKRENDDDDQIDTRKPFWTLNLMSGPGKNVLPRAGVFTSNIQAAIQSARQFIKKAIGVEPSNDILANSLKSSFILSEIKNQIEWQRKNAQNANGIDDELLT
ncbi:MAG: hypothetical protein JRE65_15095 [Deltaproteobacteria bacterium]|nr:hypothetical protein [Deltaproteobacteria bacterium]